MAIVNGYATLAEVKSRLDITDTDNDTEIEAVIEGISRWIDREIGKRRGMTTFYTNTQTMYFTAQWGDRLIIPDLVTLTTLKTDDNGDGTFETTWTSSDYHLAPFNSSAFGEPYTEICISETGDNTFPRGVTRGVEIVGDWGYSSSTPDVINEACILASMRLWKRRDAIFGVGGQTALGVVTVSANLQMDADVQNMLHGINSRVV